MRELKKTIPLSNGGELRIYQVGENLFNAWYWSPRLKAEKRISCARISVEESAEKAIHWADGYGVTPKS